MNSKYLLSLSVLLVATLSSVYSYTDAALADQITNLPGSENIDIPFNQFSGYLEINDDTGYTKYVHYWMVESENDPANDPVVFWTNGGPGCSGLLGFMTEQGPFRPQADGSLITNEYAWNKIANMVFIEQPAGVGFSYADDDRAYSTNDSIAAQDNYLSLLSFYEKFPEYQSNELYISSESYGGHYIPMWSKYIVDQKNTDLNFKGWLVGNPYVEASSNNWYQFQTYWGHQLVSKPTWDEYSQYCNLEVKNFHPVKCAKLESQMYDEMGDLNPYALDFPVCTDSMDASVGRAQHHWLHNHIAGEHLKDIVGDLDGYEPCTDDWTVEYLNRPDVKKAIHVQTPTAWTECSYTLDYSMASGRDSMVPYYEALVNGDYDLKMLVYSGDDDSICATSATQWWIYDLGVDVSSSWRSWEVEGQVAGYITKFDLNESAGEFSFATVHAAGHEVPAYQPERGFDLFQKFLNDDSELFDN